jgi:mutator protein MutT
MVAAAASAPGPEQIVAALVVDDARVLLCHRCADRQWYPEVWDLPGGHVEAGETPASALVRELREELGILIDEPAGPELLRVRASDFDLRIWVVAGWAGDLVNAAPAEHDDLAWFSASQLAGLRLAHDSYASLITKVLAR